MSHKSYFFAAGATQKSTHHSPTVIANAEKQTNGKICIFIKMEELKRHIDQIKALCDTNKVISLFAFGSVTTDGFSPESDIDLIVDIEENDPLTYSDNYFNLKFALEQLL